MVIKIKRLICDGYMFKSLVGAGLAWLTVHQEDVNRLNVFPVPDGDTGNNMRLTMQKAYEALNAMDEAHVGIVAEAAAKGALRGARGNSGVILSQLMGGFAHALRGHEVFDIHLMAQACQAAVDAAYKAVIDPTEGTILTVSREASDALVAYTETGSDLVDALEVLIRAAHESLARTPDLLPALKKAGVVDSGGQGLVFILEGMARLLHGEPLQTPYAAANRTHPVPYSQISGQSDLSDDDNEDEGYGYDVQFLMMGEALDVAKIRADIDALGWSTLVVGDENLVKVHVHVHNPGIPLSYAIESGAYIDDIVVENMQRQYEQRFQNSPSAPADAAAPREVEGVAVVAVASGAGMQRLFYEELNAAYVIAGGQTMNPDVEDFISVIECIPNDEIVLLPNNPNIIMAARQAAGMVRHKVVRVVETRTLPQGINAMLLSLEMRPTQPIDEVVAVMQEAAAAVITGQITTAVRDSLLDDVDIHEGQFIGLLNNTLVASGDNLQDTLQDLLQKAGADEHELITLYYGEASTQPEAQALVNSLQRQFPQQTFHVVDGGQLLYPYIISIE